MTTRPHENSLVDQTERRWISQTHNHIQSLFLGEGSGHDWYHVERVWKIALDLTRHEGGDRLVIELGALLHDLGDWKFRGGDEKACARESRAWLESLDAPRSLVERVCTLVTEISFKGAGVATPTSSLEAAIVQDADRLDAMGAIGIARAFAYGGSRGRPLYDPTGQHTLHDSFDDYKMGRGCTISHFHEKLLLLKDRMNTPSGKRKAEARHRFMIDFLERFRAEWQNES